MDALTPDDLRSAAGTTLVVAGRESCRVYFTFHVDAIACPTDVLHQLAQDISAFEGWEGEAHDFAFTAAPDVDDFDNCRRTEGPVDLYVYNVADFAPAVRAVLEGRSPDLLHARGDLDEKALWHDASTQRDESLYLRVTHLFPGRRRLFLGDDQILSRVIERDWQSVLAQLAADGVDFNQKNAFGQTPLHLAARQGRIEIMRFLLARGVDPVARDHAGKTPLQHAMHLGDDPAVHALLWPLECPAAARRQQKLDDLTRP